MSFLLIVIILILRKYSNDSAIWMLIKLAGFTYGPLIGLFFFGIITDRELRDKLVPLISLTVPAIVAIVWYLHGQEKIPLLGTEVWSRINNLQRCIFFSRLANNKQI